MKDITSKKCLDNTLEKAVKWCRENLPIHLFNFQNGFNYEIFNYVIDNNMIGSDMRLDNKVNGLIRVSTEKLKWYQQREDHFKKYGIIRYAKKQGETIRIGGTIEIDPESMFVHEITEFIVSETPEILLHYFSRMEFPHSVAYHIENINRMGRGLKLWPTD